MKIVKTYYFKSPRSFSGEWQTNSCSQWKLQVKKIDFSSGIPSHPVQQQQYGMKWVLKNSKNIPSMHRHSTPRWYMRFSFINQENVVLLCYQVHINHKLTQWNSRRTHTEWNSPRCVVSLPSYDQSLSTHLKLIYFFLIILRFVFRTEVQ